LTTTPIFGLKKPDATDAVKRQDFNDNWDLLDTHKHDLSAQTGVVPVIKGGTGATTAAAARAALGIGDASSLTSGTLSADRLPTVPIEKGGTGGTDPASARSALGAAGTAVATPAVNGLLSATDKSKLDGVAVGANNYTHPASGVTAGTFVKVIVNAQGHVTGGSSGPAAVADGGTGATDAAGARVNLGSAASSHASDTGANGVASAALYGHAMASSLLPLAAGVASAGEDNGKYAREKHVHPAQTDVTGNAGTASKLATPRLINGMAFDGGADINFGALAPVEIPTSADLNDYTTPGMYFAQFDSVAQTLANTPTSIAFFLLVGKHKGASQQVTEYAPSNPKVYMRNYTSGTWGAWYRVYTTADAPTSVSGNAGTATKWATARNVSITGGATAAAVALDGTGDIALSVTALDMSKANAGTLPIARGGTGATDAATARTNLGVTLANLGAAASVHGHALTDANITGMLPVAQGGTGQTTLALARNAMGLGNTTGAVPVANGGTGATSASAALTNLGIIYAATLPTTVVNGQIILIPLT
jgi:hypothetical protein